MISDNATTHTNKLSGQTTTRHPVYAVTYDPAGPPPTTATRSFMETFVAAVLRLHIEVLGNDREDTTDNGEPATKASVIVKHYRAIPERVTPWFSSEVTRNSGWRSTRWTIYCVATDTTLKPRRNWSQDKGVSEHTVISQIGAIRDFVGANQCDFLSDLRSCLFESKAEHSISKSWIASSVTGTTPHHVSSMIFSAQFSVMHAVIMAAVDRNLRRYETFCS